MELDITNIFWAIWIASFGVSIVALWSRSRRRSGNTNR